MLFYDDADYLAMVDYHPQFLQYIEILLFVVIITILAVFIGYVPLLLGKLVDRVIPRRVRDSDSIRIKSILQTADEQEKSKKQEGEIIFRQMLW